MHTTVRFSVLLPTASSVDGGSFPVIPLSVPLSLCWLPQPLTIEATAETIPSSFHMERWSRSPSSWVMTVMMMAMGTLSPWRLTP